jgi:oxygen-independent coproporphyrinogen-3 oxidase
MMPLETTLDSNIATAPATSLPTSTTHSPVVETRTAPGNYFVANYPPFSFWKPELVGDVIHALSQPPVPGTPLGLYCHLPFCRRRCHFCYFRVYTGKDARPDRVAGYVDTALKELSIYAQQPLIAGRRPRYVYFGGGTPSFLSVEQLEQLFGGMKKILPWDDVEEVTFECEPGTLTDEKLRCLRDLGVTRLSLGVEHFDDDILKSNGRAHLSKEIHRAYDFARAIGFPQINIDLIAGMLNETEEKWKSCVEQAVKLAADCVTIYQMEVPFNTTIYREMHERGEIVSPVADWLTKRRWVDYAYAELERAGYTVTSAYTAVRNPQSFRFLYRDYLWKGADMVSLGVASFGHLRGAHYQNEKDYDPYMARIQEGELPIHRGLAMNDSERLVREMILQMKLGGLEAGYFREKFGVEILSRFAAPLEELRAAGHLTIDGDRVSVNRAGLLRIDELLHVFFLPEHRGARYT